MECEARVERLLGDLLGMWLAPLLEGLERGADRAGVAHVDPLELAGEEVAVLDRHARAVGGVGGGRVGGIADERRAALGPLLERLAIADLPALQVLASGLLDQRRQRVREAAGSCQRELVQVLGERLARVERLEHPPLVAPFALVADRGVAAL